MLNKLKINNFVIIDTAEINFCSGLNVIIGETGAGKSIIIDAISILFGEKTDTTHIKSGTTKTIIEGSFFFEENSPIFEHLTELNITLETNEVIIRREIHLKGNARCFINDNPVNVTTLKNFTTLIFDIYNQNEHHKILNKQEQFKIIDNLLENKTLLTDYKTNFTELKQTQIEYNALLTKKNNEIERKEVITKLLNEIIEVNPKENEDNFVKNELIIMENSENIVNIINNITNILDENDNQINKKLNQIIKQLNKLTEIDNVFAQFQTEISATIITINEIADFISKYKSKIEFNAEQIEKLRNRSAEIRKLTKKYGSITEIINKKIEYKTEISLFENAEENINNLINKKNQIKTKLFAIAAELTNERTKNTKILAAKLTDELAKMGIENANIHFKIEETELNENGKDNITFLISTNKGETPNIIDKVASGGEISRIILAIKTILSEKSKVLSEQNRTLSEQNDVLGDKNNNLLKENRTLAEENKVLPEQDTLPLLIFDEIDAGISGRIAQRVGKVIRNLATRHQIISVTHLPQIAAMGNNIILVEKSEIGSGTTIKTRTLSEKEKIIEIARLISGETITNAAIKSAKELCKIDEN